MLHKQIASPMLSNEISYDAALVPVRSDIGAVHCLAWQHLGEPGSWWTGSQRVSIALAVREAASCSLCAAIKTGLHSSSASASRHQTVTALPPTAVETIHWITMVPGSVTKNIYYNARLAGITDGHYVEMLGVLSTVITVDMFHRALGLPPPPPPRPQPGTPSGYRPPVTRRLGAWVPTLDRKRTIVLPPALKHLGRATSILHALSIVPAEAALRVPFAATHYVPEFATTDVTYQGSRALSRIHLELLAARTAFIQECFYGLYVHSRLLVELGRRQGTHINTKGITDTQIDTCVDHGSLLCRFVAAVQYGTERDRAAARQEVRAALGDRGLVDVCAVVAHFNAITRIADATGVLPDEPLHKPVPEELALLFPLDSLDCDGCDTPEGSGA